MQAAAASRVWSVLQEAEAEGGGASGVVAVMRRGTQPTGEVPSPPCRAASRGIIIKAGLVYPLPGRPNEQRTTCLVIMIITRGPATSRGRRDANTRINSGPKSACLDL